MLKLKKGDEVIIFGGKDKGKRGKIERIIVKTDRVMVAGINAYKRHMKRRDEKNPGGIIEFFRPLPIARVALVCPKCGQPTRIGFSVKGNEKRRMCRKCDQII